MTKEFHGSQVPLSSGPKTGRDDGRTGKPEMQMVGSSIPMPSTPVNDFRSNVSEGTYQTSTGEKVSLNRNPVAPYEGAPLSIRADKQQGSGR